MAFGDWYTPYEDEYILTSKSHGVGYKRIGHEINRTRDSVRSRYRELIGEGRDTRRENRAIGGKSDRVGWLARRS